LRDFITYLYLTELDVRSPECTIFSVEEAAVAEKWKGVQKAGEKLEKKSSSLAVERMKVPSIRYINSMYRKRKNERRMHKKTDEASN